LISSEGASTRSAAVTPPVPTCSKAVQFGDAATGGLDLGFYFLTRNGVRRRRQPAFQPFETVALLGRGTGNRHQPFYLGWGRFSVVGDGFRSWVGFRDLAERGRTEQQQEHDSPCP
jgi:hypothetical protein